MPHLHSNPTVNIYNAVFYLYLNCNIETNLHISINDSFGISETTSLFDFYTLKPSDALQESLENQVCYEELNFTNGSPSVNSLEIADKITTTSETLFTEKTYKAGVDSIDEYIELQSGFFVGNTNFTALNECCENGFSFNNDQVDYEDILYLNRSSEYKVNLFFHSTRQIFYA